MQNNKELQFGQKYCVTEARKSDIKGEAKI